MQLEDLKLEIQNKCNDLVINKFYNREFYLFDDKIKVIFYEAKCNEITTINYKMITEYKFNTHDIKFKSDTYKNFGSSELISVNEIYANLNEGKIMVLKNDNNLTMAISKDYFYVSTAVTTIEKNDMFNFKNNNVFDLICEQSTNLNKTMSTLEF